MVLQEDMQLVIWGTAGQGEPVTVVIGDKSAKTTAQADGKWKVNLPALPINATPVTMTVTGQSNTLTFTDILVGEVWLCSGQSNMEFNLGGGKYGFGGAHDASTVLPQANDPQMRFFVVGRKTSLDPVDDVEGKWVLCTTETAARFSALGYFFGRELRQTLNKPVGLIGSYWSGTPAEAWTSLSGLEKEPSLKNYVDLHDKLKANFAQATSEYPAKKAEYDTAFATWSKDVEPTYTKEMKDWEEDVKQSLALGQPAPLAPKPSAPKPQAPVTPDGGPHAPTALYNGMIAPLVPFPIKGAIWYQGEANAGNGARYRTLFPAMITDWRQQWGEENFPFLFVQLAGYMSGPVENWPYLREAQLTTLSLPNTGMATAIDIGAPTDIHPRDKDDLGHRLALAARHIAYGENLVYSGPIYQTSKIDGSAISLTFTDIGSGLVIGKAPWVANGFKPIPDDELVGFTIAGEDKIWTPADAKIVGNNVVVSSASVIHPVSVRYDWANNPQGNLYNKEGLPASPFRIDSWSDPAAEGTIIFNPKK